MQRLRPAFALLAAAVSIAILDPIYAAATGEVLVVLGLRLSLFAGALLIGAAVLHGAFLLINGGLPRWAGGVLIAAYGWFVYAGLLS